METEESCKIEVLCETRRHASWTCNSNYLEHLKKRDCGKGGFLSLLSAQGISELRQRWCHSSLLPKTKRRTSLFISHNGDRVAVAVGDHITILRKEDDYQEPFGMFSGKEHALFTSGVWSESLDTFGVMDDAGTLYLIKSNGEEITRATKRQLKGSLTILGLIALEGDTEALQSCLCYFVALARDGTLYHIDVSMDPSASISASIRGSGLTRGQFPVDVFCFTYDPENCWLLVVGSFAHVSLGYGGNAGSYLSIWHRGHGLDLEQLSSTQFEGTYDKPKGYVGQLVPPKVSMPTHGKFAAALDILGCLHLFEVDKENHSISYAHHELVSDVLDFTWWSDRIVIFAKNSGAISLVDALAGSTLKEMGDVAYSMPVLGRAQQFQGCIFISGIKCFDALKDSCRDVSNLPRVSRLQCSLVSITRRSVLEMYDVLIGNHEYEEALRFAEAHNLDGDKVFKLQWLESQQGVDELNGILSNVKDLGFVLGECVNKVGPTEDVVKAFLQHGLHITDSCRFSESETDECGRIWNIRMARLKLLQFGDRLESYMGINMGRFSEREYSEFRVASLREAAVKLCESGKVGAVDHLLKRHPYSLLPFLLEILPAIPETIPVRTYAQLLPGRCPPANNLVRQEDWVECDKMVAYLQSLEPGSPEIEVHFRTEAIVKRFVGLAWPSGSELSVWYKNRICDVDSCSGQLEDCLCWAELAERRGFRLQRFHEDVSCLHQLIYHDGTANEMLCKLSLVEWERLSDYEKFAMMLRGTRLENVVKLLLTAITLMGSRSSVDGMNESFLVRWLKEIAAENMLHVCLVVIEEGCRDLRGGSFFKDERDATGCAIQCIHLCTLTDKWMIMAAILSKLPPIKDAEKDTDGLQKRIKITESHIEAGRLLALYQVPKPIKFFVEAHHDEKELKQVIRLVVSKFVRRQHGRSDNIDWENLWRDMQLLRDIAFPFLDPEFMLLEFCRGLLKAGKFSLAKNYLKGGESVSLPSNKVEDLVIQVAQEYFYSASTLTCSEISKARECLNLCACSPNIKAEIDVIHAVTVKLPNLGVFLLPMQFRQKENPMEVVRMAINGQSGAYVHVDEVIEVAKLLGLASQEDVCVVEEAIARESAVVGDLQLALDLCLNLAKKGHAPVWDLCAAIARGPCLEHVDATSRKKLLGFALSYCDAASIGELLRVWKELDMEDQCQALMLSSEREFSGMEAKDFFSEWENGREDQGTDMDKVRETIWMVARPRHHGDLGSFLQQKGRMGSFITWLPWLLKLSSSPKDRRELISGSASGKGHLGIQTQSILIILTWLARNGFAPRDCLVTSLAKLILDPPFMDEADAMGCALLMNLLDATRGVEVIEEQMGSRKGYHEIHSIVSLGMTISALHESEVECKRPAQRRDLLLHKFKEEHMAVKNDERHEIEATFWSEWKLKLGEKLQIAERARMLGEVIPGIETERFLSGDNEYIKHVAFSLMEWLGQEKKLVLKDLLQVADTYGLDRAMVLQSYLGSALVSEAWDYENVMTEILDAEEDLKGHALETIKTISLVVYPAVDGHDKLRLACLYELLSNCYLQLEETPDFFLAMHPSSSSPCLPPAELARFYRILEQECRRISFVQSLDFKNVAGLDGPNLHSLTAEICANLDESNVDALADLVRTLVCVDIDADVVPGGIMTWQDVYKHYVVSGLTALESRARAEPAGENLDEFLAQVEETYGFGRPYMRLFSPADALAIAERYFRLITHLQFSCEILPHGSSWKEWLVLLLNFWVRLSEEMVEISAGVSGNQRCLSAACLGAFLGLALQDGLTPAQGWSTVLGYARCGLAGDLAAESLVFCRSMVLSGCSFGIVSEVYSEAASQHTQLLHLAHLYADVLQAMLQSMATGAHDHQNLCCLLSSLSKLEALQEEELQRVRAAVWEGMLGFLCRSQIPPPDHAQVCVFDLMQFFAGRKAESSCLQQQSVPWEGWDGVILAGEMERKARECSTTALVALRSSELAGIISPGFEVASDVLHDHQSAVSCFMELLNLSSADLHLNVLLAILAEWEEVLAAEDESRHHNWSSDDWEKGWDTLEEDEEGRAIRIHPLHVCWAETFMKFIQLGRLDNVLREIDASLSSSNGTLLNEDESEKLLSLVFLGDCFAAQKVALVLPYKQLQFQYLGILEKALQQQGISDLISHDQEFLILVLASGIMSTIATSPCYGAAFSYVCFLVENFFHWRGTDRHLEEEEEQTMGFMILFRKILLPWFVCELVKANQHPLARRFISEPIRPNGFLSFFKPAEVGLDEYLEIQLGLLPGRSALEKQVEWVSISMVEGKNGWGVVKAIRAKLLALIIKINVIFLVVILIFYALLLRPSSVYLNSKYAALLSGCSLPNYHHQVENSIKMKMIREEMGSGHERMARKNRTQVDFPSFIKDIKGARVIGMVNMEDDDVSKWERLVGEIITVHFDPISKRFKWEDLFPEWIDEEEDDGPSCPEIPMPNFEAYDYKMDMIVAKLPCKHPEAGWNREVLRLQVHLVAANLAVRRGRRSWNERCKVMVWSKCRPIMELFKCDDLVKQEGHWRLYEPNMAELEQKLSLPVGSCKLALPLWPPGSHEKSPNLTILRTGKCGPPTREAYATVLHSSDSYVCGAIALARSLRKTGTKRDLILLLDSSISQPKRAALAAAGWILRNITRIRNPKAENNSYNEYNYSKLRLFQLTDYGKIVFIDSDILVFENLDVLFMYPQMSAVGNDMWTFNSGIMVIQPSNCTFKTLMELSQHVVSHNGGDQGFLNEVFVWWHRLPRRVNYLKNFWANSTLERSIKEQMFREEGKVYAIHYLGVKPWRCYRDYDCNWNLENQRVYASDAAHERWWRSYDGMALELKKFCRLTKQRRTELDWDRKMAQEKGFADGHWKANVTDPRRLHLLS